MARLVALLRGMNLGNRRVTNDELAGHVRDAGFDGVDTYRASGNVILDAPDRPAVEVESALEARLADALGYPVDTYVRSMTELTALLDRVGPEAVEEGFKVHVIFLKEPADDDAAAALAGMEGPDDRFRTLGRDVLWLRRGRLSDADIDTRDLEAALGPLQTMRTVGTVRGIVEKYGP